MQDMRTYIAVNTSLLPLPRPMSPSDTEMWRSYPDDVEAMMKAGSQTWEPRMALTPFFAHEVCCLMTMTLSRRSLKSTACTWMHAPAPAFHCGKLDASRQLLVSAVIER